MPSEIQKVPALPEITAEICSIIKNAQKGQWRASQLLYIAREEYFSGDDKGFYAYAEKEFSYVQRTTDSYLETYTRFKDHKLVGADQKSENPIPFTKLAEISGKKVKPDVVKKIVDKLVSKKPPSFRDVRKLVKDSLPEYKAPPIQYLPDFAVRAERKGRFTASPAYLFGISENTPAETIRILAKHWKGKYHPDKPEGDKDIFQRILKAETALLAERGEK